MTTITYCDICKKDGKETTETVHYIRLYVHENGSHTPLWSVDLCINHVAWLKGLVE